MGSKTDDLTGLDEKVDKLVLMGFDAKDVKAALEQCNGDENIALEKLLSGT